MTADTKTIGYVFCAWCGAKQDMPPDVTAELVRDWSKAHMFECDANPLKIEVDRLRSVVRELGAALVEVGEAIADEAVGLDEAGPTEAR